MVVEKQDPALKTETSTVFAASEINPIAPALETTPTPQPRKKTWLIAAMAIILAAVLGALGLLAYRYYYSSKLISKNSSVPTATPTSDETAGWKTYRSQEYGFEIKYPENLSVRENKNPTTITSVDFISSDGPGFEFRIEKNFLGGWMGKEVKKEKVIVDGVEGTISLWLGCDSNIGDEWEKCNEKLDINNYDHAFLNGSFQKGDDKWSAFYTSWKKGQRDNDGEMKKLATIISTFKFLDSADETAGWKSYKNEAYGFSFKYPKELILEDKSAGSIAQVLLAAQGFRETMVSANKQGPVNLYLDQASAGDVVIGNLTGKKFFLPDGYCDGPTCSAPILAAVVYKNGFRYVFSTFVGKDASEFTDLEKKILSTFKFTD